MSIAWLLVFLTGCNGERAHKPVETPATATPPEVVAAALAAANVPEPIDPTAVGEPPAGVPAPAYAVLFEKGRAWKVEGTHVSESYIDGQNERTEEKFATTCKVEEVGRHPWGVTSTVYCDGDGIPGAGMANLLEGGWVATAKGLYNVSSTPSEKMELKPDFRVLPPAPVAYDVEEKLPDGEGWFVHRTVSAEGEGWCYDLSSAAGDEGWHGVCIDPKTGITSGSYGWAGGSSQEVTFSVVP